MCEQSNTGVELIASLKREPRSLTMPIAFPSKSHGQIPIGFFNIETDMLLMGHYFFFSMDFCEWIVEWTANKDANRDEKMIYLIPQREMIGNLSGAIHGYEFTGFIGEVYKLFPFPESHADFKQKPYGTQNRSVVEQTIQPYAERLKVPIVFHKDGPTIDFGVYTFSAEVFRGIIGYIEAGGMPGWLNGPAPDYVIRMMAKLAITHHQHLRKEEAYGNCMKTTEAAGRFIV